MIQRYGHKSGTGPAASFGEDNEGKYVLYADHLAARKQALEKQREEWRDNKRCLENDLALKMEQIAYYKERACCDPSNNWGHTKDCKITALTEELKSLTEAYNNTDWKKKNDEQKDTINKIVIGWGKKLRQLTAENKLLRDRLKTHGDIQTDEEESQGNFQSGHEKEAEDEPT